MKPFAAKKSPWARDTRGIRGARRVTTAALALPLTLAVALPLAAPAAAQENAPQPNPSIFGDIVDPDSIPERIPQSVENQDLPGLPDGVSVEKVEWLTDRWANVYINSAAMPGLHFWRMERERQRRPAIHRTGLQCSGRQQYRNGRTRSQRHSNDIELQGWHQHLSRHHSCGQFISRAQQHDSIWYGQED